VTCHLETQVGLRQAFFPQITVKGKTREEFRRKKRGEQFNNFLTSFQVIPKASLN
jgi:hypothetical protein